MKSSKLRRIELLILKTKGRRKLFKEAKISKFLTLLETNRSRNHEYKHCTG